MSDRPRVGISACLLGQHVRFDGGHKRDAFLVETFGRFVEWVPFCPEMEAGFGAPREPMRLVYVPGRPDSRSANERGGPRTAPRQRSDVAVVTRSGADVTAPLVRAAARLARDVEEQRLSGFVLKKKSPSCGLERVTVYGANGMPRVPGRGVFAAALTDRLPTLPVEEEGRLSDPRLRENFVERVFAYRRLQILFSGRWTIGDVVAFHTAHKLTLMAHSTDAYRAIGRLVATAKSRSRGELRAAYERAFMDALTVVASPKQHANVLLHMMGYFRKSLDPDTRAELASLIEEYRLGRVPLIVPITLIKHHVRRVGAPYLAGQVYLDPHPKELALRNHV